jgi:hypothetical protein
VNKAAKFLTPAILTATLFGGTANADTHKVTSPGLESTPHPTAAWLAQLGRNLVMDLKDAGAKAKFIIRTGTRSWNDGCRPAGTRF